MDVTGNEYLLRLIPTHTYAKAKSFIDEKSANNCRFQRLKLSDHWIHAQLLNCQRK